jgi:hypothetical protein
MFEELWNYGFPKEMEHFVSCVRDNKTPLVGGEDGRAVLEIIFAAYESARTGAKVKVTAPLPEGWTLDRTKKALQVRSLIDSYR